MSIFSKLFSFGGSKEKETLKVLKIKDPVIKTKKTTPKKRKVILNERTGYPMSTKKSIESALQNYEASIIAKQYYLTHPYDDDFNFLSEFYSKEDIQTFRKQEKEKEFFHKFSVSMDKGIYLYRKGEWAEAEKEWLSIFNLVPKRTSEKLAIMYHKENRLRDEIKIVKLGIMKSNEMETQPTIEMLKKRLERAEKYYERHWNEDVSEGINSKIF